MLNSIGGVSLLSIGIATPATESKSRNQQNVIKALKSNKKKRLSTNHIIAISL